MQTEEEAIEMAVQQAQKHQNSLDFTVFSCPTTEALQEVIDENKDKEGYYPYYIPQAQGCIFVVATTNLEALAARTPTAVFKGRQLMTEKEAKGLIEKCSYITKIDDEDTEQRNTVDTFITWLYERDYEICEKIDKKKEE